MTEAFTFRRCRMWSNYLFPPIAFLFCLCIHLFISVEGEKQISDPDTWPSNLWSLPKGNWGKRDRRQFKRVRSWSTHEQAERERERANRNLRRCGSLIWPLLKNLGPEELDVTQLGCVRERFLLFFSVNQSLHHLNVEDVNFNEK